ncbi:MAG TPA: chromosomal replication initiator protein DnaA [Rhodocyclaceae bacterium]
MEVFWNTCLSQLAEEMPAQQFSTWIRPLTMEPVTDGNGKRLRIVAPNGFILKWVRERFLARIASMAESHFGEPVVIDIVAGGAVASGERKREAAVALAEAPVAAARQAAVPMINGVAAANGTEPDRGRLINGFTFDNLVVGKANDLARAAGMQVAEHPGGAYNPLFVYGGAGLGKTHLIHAIGNFIADQSPSKSIRYIHAEDYYNDVVRAYQQKAFDAFKRSYRSVDVLLLDDVQFFNGKNRSQEEFFFLFNSMIEARKQIVITCDTYPKDINGLEDRLITRFDWGLTVQIEPPELEMRVAIIKKKAEGNGIALPDDVAFFIAKHLRSNVRELEGALNRVLAYARFHGQAISVELSKDALKDVVGAFNRQITIDNIQKTVADYFNIRVGDLYSKKRARIIVRPRQVAMWLCKEVTPHSYPVIGEAFGGRDHTTVIHAVRTIEAHRAKDGELNHALHVLLQVLKG